MNAYVHVGVSGNDRFQHRTGAVDAAASCRGEDGDYLWLFSMMVEPGSQRREPVVCRVGEVRVVVEVGMKPNHGDQGACNAIVALLGRCHNCTSARPTRPDGGIELVGGHHLPVPA